MIIKKKLKKPVKVTEKKEIKQKEVKKKPLGKYHQETMYTFNIPWHLTEVILEELRLASNPMANMIGQNLQRIVDEAFTKAFNP